MAGNGCGQRLGAERRKHAARQRRHGQRTGGQRLGAERRKRAARQRRWPGNGRGQRLGAERRKLAANGAADTWGDAVNSTAAKAMPPR